MQAQRQSPKRDISDDAFREEKKEDRGSSPNETSTTRTKLDTTSGRGRQNDDGAAPPNPSSVTPENPHHPSKLASVRRWGLVLLRTLSVALHCLSYAALACAFFGYVSTHVAERVAQEYILPLIRAQVLTPERRAKELTYYHRRCTVDDLTTRRAEDLVIDYGTMTPDDAYRHQLKHGASIFPNLLSEETAHEVREFILKQNLKNEDMIDVIENKDRWSFGMRVDQHPSVARALHEVLSHPFLVETIEKVMGPDPAVIEFTGITSAYGAKKQRWHADVVPEGNGVKWGRSFVPSYSLFIPLQNVTAAMGATEICPGSHMCADGCFEYCPDHGFQVSGEQDRWVQGYGALVNQQTMHLGAAHRDKNGPHRVLFILTFAPRPRYGEQHVETRMIGQGGSYSLHWSQWGHTLSDFRDAPVHMEQPWRTLRSFGLYKPTGRNWGYDYITQASARIANDELGFYHNDLEAYIRKGGFELLPEWLQPREVPKYDESSYDLWVPYYTQTLKMCQSALEHWHKVLLVSTVVLGAFAATLSATESVKTFATGVGSVFLMHAFILVLAWLYMDGVAQSPWGMNIRTDRAYRWPELPHPVSPRLPATLPTDADVLVFDDLQSKHFAAVTDVMETTHPGNAAWAVLAENRSVGFHRLPKPLQRHLCTSLISWGRQQGRRVLLKNADGDWADAGRELAVRWCHKDLSRRSNPVLNQVLRELDFLLSRAKFGRLRETAMVRGNWTTGQLFVLQETILGLASRPAPSPASKQQNVASHPLSFRSFTKTAKSLAVSRSPFIALRIIKGLPPVVDDSGRRWIQVGDDVEAAYESMMTEWYRATVISAGANDMTWGVVYEDGESEFGLCENCVRPFRPFEVGEIVGWRNRQGTYEDARIVGVDAKAGTYNVSVGTALHSGVGTRSLRRVAKVAFAKGARVHVYVIEEEDWYLGTITQVNEADGTFAVLCDDGDFLEGVESRHLAKAGANA